MNSTPFISNPLIDDYLRQGNVADAFAQPLGQPAKDPLAGFFAKVPQPGDTRQETALYAGLTLGDVLYDYIRIDPTVVEGVDFARAEDLKSVFAFSEFAHQQMDLGPDQFSGSLSQMQGYVAERLVAFHLEAQGHDVTFPATSNQEGWDLLVDGKRFQVKCLASAGGVHEHLHRFPDIPVIVNAELADAVGGQHNVYIDPVLHHDQVVKATADSLNYGNELGDFEIPWISLGVSSAFALRDLVTNKTTVDAAVINVLSNTTGRIVLGKVGSISAGMAGLFLFGPAGKLLFTGAGAIGGAYFGRRAAGTIRKMLLNEEDQQVRAAARECADEAVGAINQKLLAWREKEEAVNSSFSAAGNAGAARSLVIRRMADDIRYFENKGRELKNLADSGGNGDPRELWQRLLTMIRRAGLHPHTVQGGLERLKDALERYQAGKRKYAI
jgi:hypothetical protein